MAQAQKSCLTRLQKEYKALLKEPVPGVTAHPNPSNLLEWHFVLEGSKDSEFAGGVYWGKVMFPPNYPFKPPSITMITPNGRFATNMKICLSFTDFHVESWNPMWSVGTILTGLLSFMYDNQPTTGSINASKQERQRLAQESLAFNLRQANFRKMFPEWQEEQSRRQGAAAATAKAAAVSQQQADGADGNGAMPGSEAAGAAGAAANGGPNGQPPNANAALTVAMCIALLAIAAVPLFSSGSGFSWGHLSDKLWRR